METTTILFLFALLLYIDAMAIYYAHKSEMFERTQLIMQALIVILIPYIGGIFVLMFSLSQLKKQPAAKLHEKSKARILNYLFLSFILVNNSTSQEYGASESGVDLTGGDGGSGD